jgi:CBS domain-containing protein
MTADELSDDFTSGGQQAWLNTLKHGLGKFSTVGNISTAYLSRRHPVRTVKNTSSLYDICKVLSMPHTHRVALVDSLTNRIIDIVSHRTIIKYLFENKDTFFTLNINDELADKNIVEEESEGEDEKNNNPDNSHKSGLKSLLDKCIDDLNIGTRNLTQIRDDILGLDALQEMDEHNHTGLAVVDDVGRLVGATSTRTIKRVTAHRDHKTMSQPLLDFISTLDDDVKLEEGDDEYCMVSHGAVVLLDEEVTFAQILSAMYRYNTNRVFLVDEDSYPSKVISFSDIIQLLIY